LRFVNHYWSHILFDFDLTQRITSAMLFGNALTSIKTWLEVFFSKSALLFNTTGLLAAYCNKWFFDRSCVIIWVAYTARVCLWTTENRLVIDYFFDATSASRTSSVTATQCSRIRRPILPFFSDFKNVTFNVFFEMTCQKVVKGR